MKLLNIISSATNGTLMGNILSNPIVANLIHVLTAKRINKNITRLCGAILMVVAFIVGGLHREISSGNTTTAIVGVCIILILTIIYSILDAKNIESNQENN